MKVLYIIDSLQVGGAETSLFEISSRLRSYTPVVCTVLSIESSIKANVLERGIQLIELNVNSRLWFIEGVYKFKKVVQEVKPDIIHATLYKSEIITRLALLGSQVPYLGTFVSDSYAPNRYKGQSIVRNMKLDCVRLFDFITARFVPHFISISNTIALSNARYLKLDRNKITCIYRGRNVEEYIINHPKKTDTVFTFLAVGRLISAKGYQEIFKAARILKTSGIEFQIQIAGEGPEHYVFQKIVFEYCLNNQVIFLKSRTDIPELLGLAHCFLFSSHYEGQGGALVEAMLAAKPIIASDIDVFREQLVENFTAKLFCVFDANDLADKMKWMIENYEKGVELGFNARKVAIERFNIQTVVDMHESLYERLIKEYSKL